MTSDSLASAAVASVEEEFAIALRAARDRVAAQPKDEAAAKALFDLVRSAVASGTLRVHDASPQPASSAVGEAVRLLAAGEDEQAELVLRRHLAASPDDTGAMIVMARLAARCGYHENAERILRRATQVEPRNADNWLALARFLLDWGLRTGERNRIEEALDVADAGLRADRHHYATRSFRAALLIKLRQLDEAVTSLEELVCDYPLEVIDWLNLGHVLKTTGQFAQGVAAYRVGAALNSDNGTAWFNLSNLKLAPFFPFDVQLMEEALSRGGLSWANEANIRFALARAYEQSSRPELAAPHLLAANRLRLDQRPHDAGGLRKRLDRSMTTFTEAFFADRRGWGSRSDAPIFVLGMPRSGSTLVEQILASHSQIEGTEELFAIARIAAEIRGSEPDASVESQLKSYSAAEFERLGERYISLAADHRLTTRPHFTDKNPSNWAELGLIRSILPQAKIIDIRRNPMDCCFANYTQHYDWGADFSYGQREMAGYYRDYLSLMRHFDEVAPGAVHRIIYEDLVEDVESEARRLFDYLGLELEPACLRFFETKRPVFTPSSQQVRQPINRAGIGRWEPFEPWLLEMKEALGEATDDWRR